MLPVRSSGRWTWSAAALGTEVQIRSEELARHLEGPLSRVYFVCGDDTLLGKGGLVKAYSGGVQAALATLPLAMRIPSSWLTVVIDYAGVTPFNRLLTATFDKLVTFDSGNKRAIAPKKKPMSCNREPRRDGSAAENIISQKNTVQTTFVFFHL